MGKFNKTGKRGMPELNTSSLPDLIFTMLFFFMIVTTMREVTLKVQFKVPQATELEKLEKKSLVSFIYIGKPMPEFQKKMGTTDRIQLNDKFAESSEVQDYIYQERENMKEEDKPFMTVSLNTIIITVGFLLKSTSETSSPNKCTNSSCTILTKTCPGFNEPTTSAPIAFSFVDAMNSFTT